MIDKLTDEQSAQIDVYRDKWIDIGLSCKPMNFESAKVAMIRAYETAGLPSPTQFHAVASPTAAIELIQKLDSNLSAKDIFNEFIYGCYEAGWLSYYEYFKDVCDIQDCAKLDGLTEYAKHAGWASVYEDVVVIQDRPEHILFDDQGRVHSETDVAIKYRDGTGVYMWHGVRVPAEWINKKSELSAKTALTWENIEQRRAACEIVGWAKILRELNARTIDVDDDPMIGTLVEVDIPDVGREKFLKVLCGTGREFALPVPPDMTTALGANAWTYDLDGDTLRKLEVRT